MNTGRFEWRPDAGRCLAQFNSKQVAIWAESSEALLMAQSALCLFQSLKSERDEEWSRIARISAYTTGKTLPYDLMRERIHSPFLAGHGTILGSFATRTLFQSKPIYTIHTMTRQSEA